MLIFCLFPALWAAAASPEPMGWLEVYSQSKASQVFKQCHIDSCNVSDGADFMNFDAIKGWPKYHFKFVWDQVRSGDTELEWKQEMNPLSRTNADMNPTDAFLSPSNNVPKEFIGLSLSGIADTLLDGHAWNGYWFYTVGNPNWNWNKGGNDIWNMGYNPTYYDGTTYRGARKTQLFVRASCSTVGVICDQECETAFTLDTVKTDTWVNYRKLMVGAEDMPSVWFSVVAERDIHISVSTTDTAETDSWELVLGGWGGIKSAIRQFRDDAIIVKRDHSNDQFITWSHKFEFRMTDTSIGLYDADGGVIIEFDAPQFHSTNVEYLFISTGFGARGWWKVWKDCPKDIDECNTTNQCADMAECINTIGSYECECPIGFTGNGRSDNDHEMGCVDIDECNTTNQCADMAECINTSGSYTCECPIGFTGNGRSDNDHEMGCVDTNECTTTPDNKNNYCEDNAQCTNTAGSYTCACPSGFFGNGRSDGEGCVAAQTCESSDEMQYWNDAHFNGNDIGSSKEDSVESCMDVCIANPVCNIMAFDILNRYPHNCYIKAKTNGILDMDYEGIISGIRCSYQPTVQPPKAPDAKYPDDELKKNNVVYNVGTLYEQWSISFDLMITELHDGIFNIIRVGDSIGSRLPAIYLKNKSSALEVRLDEGNLAFKTNPIPLNSWTHVWMSVKHENDGSYALNVVIDNEPAFWEQIPHPTIYSDVNIYASDDFQLVAHARIRNIEHETSPKVEDGFQLEQNNMVLAVGTLYEEWYFSFDLMITELHDGIFNVIRVGDSINSRLPAIYLKNKSSALEARMLIDGQEHAFKSDPIPLNTWTKVELFVQQEQNGDYMFRMVIDDFTIVDETQINYRSTYYGINIYATDGSQIAAHARIRNIHHETHPPVNINECNTNNQCADMAQCIDTIGSYICECPIGFTGNGRSDNDHEMGCVDTNECETNKNYCEDNAQCTNTAGSYTCACPVGFTGNGRADNDHEMGCNDIEECETNKHYCEDNAECTNTAGSYTCACPSGFVGNGRSDNAEEPGCVGGVCPSTHPWAYSNGEYCCAENKEKFYSPLGELCDGSTIALESKCCLNDAYAKCTTPPCANAEDDVFSITRNHLHETIPTLYKQWQLHVDIMPTGLVSGYTNILHVGTGPDHSRIPGIWFTDMTTVMHISSTVAIPNLTINTDPIPMDQWTSVDISLLQQPDWTYLYTIKVAGVVFQELVITDPVELSDVKVYTSNNFYESSAAQIKNLKIETFEDDIDECAMNKYDCIDAKIYRCVNTPGSYWCDKILETQEFTAQIKYDTTIAFVAALTDPSSEEFKLAWQNLLAVNLHELQEMAIKFGIKLRDISVDFINTQIKIHGGSLARKRARQRARKGSRKRRATEDGTAAVITVVYDVPISESSDLTELENELLSATTTAVNTAIANSDGTYVSPEAVASVTGSLQEAEPTEDELTEDEVKCDGMYDGDAMNPADSGCFTLNDDGECIITNPSCQSLTCTNTHMTGSFRADLINKDDQFSDARDEPLFVNGVDCGLDFIWYSDDTGEIKFEIELGSCGMLAESIDGNIKFTSVISYEATSDSETASTDGIFLAASFGNNNMAVSCSYSQIATTNDLTYQVTTSSQNYEVNQITSWAALELTFFADDTFADEVADTQLAIGTPVYLQVLWNQEFNNDFPVEFYISGCIVSDNDSNEYSVVESGCGDDVVDAVLLTDGYSQERIQYRYNSFSFTEEQTIAQQTVTCTIKFCLQADMKSGACGYESC